jgi:hypothetical protein
VRLAAKLFGREKGPLVFGWIFTGHQIGAAAATYGAGAVRTGLGNYLPAFYTAGAMCLVGALVALATGRRRQDAVASAPVPAA